MAGSDHGPFDEAYWQAYRKRLRRREGARGLLVIAPLAIGVAVVKILEPATHRAGDVRDDPAFRLVAYGLMIVFMVGLFIASARLLISERRRPD